MTHWTQSGSGEQHGNTVPIVVEEIIRNSAGEEILRTRAELSEVGEQEHAFILKVGLDIHFQLACSFLARIFHLR